MFQDSWASTENVTFMHFAARNHLPLIVDEIGDQTGRTLWVSACLNPVLKDTRLLCWRHVLLRRPPSGLWSWGLPGAVCSLVSIHVRLCVEWTSPPSVVNHSWPAITLIVWGAGVSPVDAVEQETLAALHCSTAHTANPCQHGWPCGREHACLRASVFRSLAEG